MSTLLYVRTTMTIPGAGTAIHVAEMEELSEKSCALLRMVALAPDDAVVGAATPHGCRGNAQVPQRVVPHPSGYDSFADIDAELISAADFRALWREATRIFGEL